jgi:hypothetical protein
VFSDGWSSVVWRRNPNVPCRSLEGHGARPPGPTAAPAAALRRCRRDRRCLLERRVPGRRCQKQDLRSERAAVAEAHITHNTNRKLRTASESNRS